MNTSIDKDHNGVSGEAHTSGSRHRVMKVTSLSTLVGAHPDALAAIYAKGHPADPASLGETPRGRILALGAGSGLFMATRSFLRALATDAFPWKGKVFDHGGNSGQNVLLGKRVLRFHAEVGPSAIDGALTLVLRYSDPAYKNPWPVRAVVDELRSIDASVAIGPAFFTREGRSPELLLWFGLER